MTGDLVNLSLADEYKRARAWLEALGAPRDVTVVPGNHDVYVRGASQSPAAYWGDYMRGDDGADRFPFVRRRANVALIALSTGVPTGPFMATGRLGAAAARPVRASARRKRADCFASCSSITRRAVRSSAICGG